MPSSSPTTEPSTSFAEPGVLEHLRWLKQRYPGSVLITEFVTYAANEYAVRALVQSENRILATGMAASSQLELAEDRARVRVIESLGYEWADERSATQQATPIMPPSVAEPIFPESQPIGLDNPPSVRAPAPKPAKPIKASRASSSPSPSEESDPASNSDRPSPDSQDDYWNGGDPSLEPMDPAFYDSFVDESEVLKSPSNAQPSEEPLPDNSDVESSNGSSKTQAVPESAEPQTLSGEGGRNVNLVDAIAKTSVEMHRLGWDTLQGRQHLQATYGKRSRGELTDDELLDFLKFLEQQPNPGLS